MIYWKRCNPDWTEQEYRAGGARDDLGIETLSETIQADLLPGINNQTRRARYSFRNANPGVQENDIRKATVLYRNDRKSLLFVMERFNGQTNPDIDLTGISIEKIGSVDHLVDLENEL